VSGPPSWKNLAEMDLRFARSRRRAAQRRLELPKRSTFNWRVFRIVLAAGVLFAFVGESTKLEISNARSAGGKKPARVRVGCGAPAAFQQAFRNASAKTGVSTSLLVAMAYEESRMDPHARSHAGAQGLLQLMPATARALELAQDDPSANALAGARYLKQMLSRFDGNLDLALAAYNAGPTVVEKIGAAPTLGTLTYVKNVEARAARLTGCG
jgi:soluble lytic murein transglycosylase-like protein